MINLVVVPVAVLLSTAALLALVRVVRGPSLLDRVVAVEVLLSVMVASAGTEAAVNRHVTTLPLLLGLSLLVFLGSVAIIRFVVGEES